MKRGHAGAQPSETPTRKVDPRTFRRAVALFGPHKKQVGLTLVAVMVGVLFGLLPPWFVQIIIDQGLMKKDLGVIATYSVLTIFAVLAGMGLTLLYGWMSVVIGQKIMCELRSSLFHHLQGMSLKFFTGTRTGEIQTRLISDVGGVQNVVSNTLTDALSNVAIVVSTLLAMLYFDWRLTILSVGLVPFFAILGQWMGNFGRVVRKGVQEQTAELNSMMQETLSVSGVLLTKTSGRRDVLSSKFEVENQKLAGWQIKQQVLMYTFFGLIRLITSLTPALVYWLAGYLLVVKGDTNITVGTLVAFTALQTRMFFPITGLLSVQVEIMSSLALFERIFEYLDLKHDIQDRAGAKTVDPATVQGAIEFKNVSFKYEDTSETHALFDVSFRAEPGQLVALVGPSGAGKTTLAYLIPRLYDPELGSVTLDGIDLRDITQESLTRVTGAVTQETYLVHSTIKENLRFAKPEATDAEIEQACRAAAIHQHIAGLPEGYETVVGERGYKLSGGEKQRLAIARALLKNPKILVLDEATSALDTTSERLVQGSLNSLMKGRTTFAIAHRLSTILAADQILVMQSGRIVERGTHSELLAQEGLYSRLYHEQFAPAEQAEIVEERTQPVELPN